MKYLKYISLVSLIFAIGINISMAQFVTPINSISGPAEVTTLDGTIIKGDVKMASFGSNGITSFSLKDEAGLKHKFKADEVKMLKLKVDGLAKLEIIGEQSSNLSKLAKSNFKEVTDREFIYWKRVKHPDKEKYLLLQLLNPGFDNLLEVYDLPNARTAESFSGDIAISGDMPKAFYVVKNGETLEISKKKYKKQDFELLFSDCPTIIENNKPDFKHFAEHVYFYNEYCQ